MAFGGVGSYTVEALARIGVGKFVLIDHDKVTITNINRQIHATTKTIGKYKVDLMKKRILEINPKAEVEIYKTFFAEKTEEKIIDKNITYIVDAIDTVKSKIELIIQAKKLNIPIISSMGTGNKLNPNKFEITDISKTSICPLAKIVRQELKKRNIEKVKVIYSKENPIKIKKEEYEEQTNKKQIPGSISFVPPVAGMIIAGEVIKDIIEK